MPTTINIFLCDPPALGDSLCKGICGRVTSPEGGGGGGGGGIEEDADNGCCGVGGVSKEDGGGGGASVGGCGGNASERIGEGGGDGFTEVGSAGRGVFGIVSGESPTGGTPGVFSPPKAGVSSIVARV